MDINATLLGQMITFAIFVWFTMKYVWPPISNAMLEREKRIVEGLAAAERGHRDLEAAQYKSDELLQEAKLQASQIVDQASKRGARLVEEAKEQARLDSQRLVTQAQDDINQQVNQAKQDLQKQVVTLAVAMAEKILAGNIDAAMQQKLVSQAVNEI